MGFKIGFIILLYLFMPHHPICPTKEHRIPWFHHNHFLPSFWWPPARRGSHKERIQKLPYVSSEDNFWIQFQFSCSVMSNSLPPHELQHARPPCPSPTPGVRPNSCVSSRWCHPAISSSVVPFSSCPQSLPASGSFPMSQLFTWGGKTIGVSASASVLPMNNPGLVSFRMDWLDVLAVQGALKSLLQHHSSKASIL